MQISQNVQFFQKTIDKARRFVYNVHDYTKRVVVAQVGVKRKSDTLGGLRRNGFARVTDRKYCEEFYLTFKLATLDVSIADLFR